MKPREKYVTAWREAYGNNWFSAADAALVALKIGGSDRSVYFHLNNMGREGVIQRQTRPACFFYRFTPTTQPTVEAWKAAAKDLAKMLPKSVISIFINASTGEVTVTQKVVKVDQESFTL